MSIENNDLEGLRFAPPVQNLDTVRRFPDYSATAWEQASQYLRRHILVSTGQYPNFEPLLKLPLNPQIFGKIERSDYTVEKVYFESYPGFFCTGNLYRPRGKDGPFPAIVSPHGHWDRGRLENIERGSIPGRCINFAKQGYVIFSYDMVGYNDSGQQVDHRSFPNGDREAIWGISLLGLQLQNAIRSIDFLQSLPDVDPDRIACTGASGGGTQAFMLMAIDDRIKVSAPVNMISAHMQGGCLCENAPNLRIDFSNIEIGAMMAPRPLLLVSATGDWTKDTPDVEYPAIHSIYQHFGAADKIHQVQIDAEHNYNKASREAVYQWFAKWLLENQDSSKLTEVDFTVESDEDLLVFHDRAIPYHALSTEELLASLRQLGKAAIEKRKPNTINELTAFQSEMGPGLLHALALSDQYKDSVNLVQKLNQPAIAEKATLIVHQNSQIDVLADQLSSDKHAIFGLQLKPTGRDTYSGFFNTYNRLDSALWCQDILAAVETIREENGNLKSLNLIGIDGAGPVTFLAAGFSSADYLAVDLEKFNAEDDEDFIAQLPIPSIRRVGDFRTAGALLAPKPIYLLNTGRHFPVQWIADLYQLADKNGCFSFVADVGSIPLETQIIKWLEEF
ncbi:acetylxylan esterase [Candidatus Poribacteria bacterium]|nr:acetylxylan esterase [Candidatus Poribacteria bacterium]|tara:strand:+ start:341 stop:2197 length:1857 start_codon:yes stop_codon:yes gene_type:complete